MAICGILVVGLGVGVLLGWAFGIQVIMHVLPGHTAMQPLSACCFVLSGLSLIGCVKKWPFFVVSPLAAIPAVIGMVVILGYLTGSEKAMDAWRVLQTPGLNVFSRWPSPPTVICFTLCGLALVALSCLRSGPAKRIIVWIGGSISFSVSFMAICGYLSGLSSTFAWGHFIGMAVHTAWGLAVLSSGILLTQGVKTRSFAMDKLLPLALGLFVAVATLILWQSLLAEQSRGVSRRLKIHAADFETDTRFHLEGTVRALTRMQQRWNFRGGIPYDEWQDDARGYLRDEKLLDAVEWVDSYLILRWVVSGGGNSGLEGFDVSQDNRWEARRMLEKSWSDQTMVISPTIPLKQGGMGLLIYFPLYKDKRPDGFLVGVVRLTDLVRTVLEETAFEGLHFSIWEEEREIFSSGDGEVAEAGPLHSATFAFHGHTWRVVITPSRSFLAESSSNLPNIILLLGTLLTAAGVAALRSWQKTREYSRAIFKANQMLNSEIAERRTVETKLRESEERLRLVLDSATGVSVIATAPTGTITYFSKGAERLLGYRSDEVVGKLSPAIFHEPEEVFERGRELTLQVGSPVADFDVFVTIPQQKGSERREWTYVCKDGSRRSVELTVTLRRDANGQLSGYLGTAIDITEREQLESSLRDSMQAMKTAKALLEAAGRIARVGHWELKLDGSGPSWSDITYKIHEVPLGTPISLEEALAFLHPDDVSTVQTKLQHTISTGEPFEYEARLITATKRIIWVHSRGEAIRDQKGTTVAVRGVFQDVDERHKASALLSERNTQLRDANRKAVTYARAKAEFLANMSHEIRTPLNAVIGMSELLQDVVIEARQKELVNTIRISGDALLALINDILDFSKIESGQLELESIPIDLHDCVESALDIAASTALKKQLDLLYWIEPTVPAFILGDVTRLRQVVVNLVTNAVKFTLQGEVFVRIHRGAMDNGESLRFSVRDTGIGISALQQKRLFHAFSQVDASTSRRFGGTGLGLVICQRLVTLMGGRIWVESVEGKGSEFLFEIPLKAAAVTPPTIYVRGANHDLEGLSVLIVDDNETNRWILRSQTSSWGMRTRDTGDPHEALQWVEQGDPFDLALVDGHMPDLDGYELVAKLRNYASMSKVPIVMLSSMTDGRTDLDKLGINARLTKPVKTAALFEVIGKVVLGRIHAGTASPVTPSQLLGHECPLKILVAEDNPVNQRVAELQLERLGYTADYVENGMKVLEAMGQKKFDLILLDVQMPEMDGFATAREICHLYPRAERPRIVALTADAGIDDRQECLNAGMDDFLTKPLRTQKLADMLRNTFQVRSPTR